MSNDLFGTTVYWRETHRQPRFLVFDGRVVVVLLACVMHIRPWTIALAVISLAILFYFERKGVSADSILRFIRARFVGKRRTARGHAAERSFVDYGYETAADVERMNGIAVAERKRIIALRQKMVSGKKKRSARKG